MWLLELQALRRLKQAESNADYAGISSIDKEAFLRDRSQAFSSDNHPHIYSVSGDQANIEVSGVLTKAPDIFAMLFGGGNTSYDEIMASIHIAESDDKIKAINFNIDSPGGQVKGLFDVLDAIQAVKKPTKANVQGMAASAAYALASMTDEIVASNRSDMFGSVGIVANVFVDDEVVSVTSTNAPNKAPDVRTEEGKAAIQQELDALHELFVDAIANGRTNATGKKYDKDTINSEFGRGGIVLASEAERRGMIDKIAKVDLTVVSDSNLTAASSGINTGSKSMDLQKLKAEYPEVYEAAKKDGQRIERDRVVAHLTLGKSSKALDVAHEAIETGAELDQTFTAKYLAAGMNRSDVDAMADDNAVAPNAADESQINEEQVTNDVFALVRTGMGLEA